MEDAVPELPSPLKPLREARAPDAGTIGMAAHSGAALIVCVTLQTSLSWGTRKSESLG